jgi:AcrR family transcriptional regulator
VLDAALNRLLADGFDGLTIAAVATDAGVAETTVYRRWPTKAALAAAALTELAAADNPTPDTGSLEGDLRTVLSQVLDVLRRPEVERIIRALAALPDDVPGMAEARATFFQTRVSGMKDIAARAAARGELRGDGVDAAELLESLVAPAYLRLLVTGLPLDDDLITRSARAALELAQRANTDTRRRPRRADATTSH